MRSGLVESYARPGGNVTGVADDNTALAPKRLELFTKLVPKMKKVLLIYTSTDLELAIRANAYREAARRLGIVLVERSSLSGAVRCLAAPGRVNVFDVAGRFWCDTDTPRDMDRAEQALLNCLRGKPSDGPVSRFLNRPLSVLISCRLAKFPITPNQISMVSFLFCLVAAWLFAAGGYLALALGGLVAQFASVIDGCDGEIARLKFLKSDFGRWFDAVLDRYASDFHYVPCVKHSIKRTTVDDRSDLVSTCDRQLIGDVEIACGGSILKRPSDA